MTTNVTTARMPDRIVGLPDHPGLIDFIVESNRIEGIHRAPTEAEIEAHVHFLGLSSSELRVDDLVAFVRAVQPNARLRDREGLNVRVGNHVPILGGPEVGGRLRSLLARVNFRDAEPYATHRAYETLHPFTDGNGRSGRVLWLWMMLRAGQEHMALGLGFLHCWYYQSLASS